MFNGRCDLKLVEARYECNDRLADYLTAGGELFLFVSVNLPDEPLDEGEFAVKTYSENEGLLEALIVCGAVVFTGRYTTELGLPICRLCRPVLSC